MGLDASKMEKTTGILILFLFFAGCGNEIKENKIAAIGTDKVITNFTLTKTEGAKKKWVLNAESARLKEINGNEIIEAKDFNINFFTTEYSETSLKALFGIYNRKTQILKTTGKVELKSADKTIITKDVNWNPQRNTFITDKLVTIHTAQGTMQGKGMEASRDLSDIKLFEKISVEIQD